MPPSGAPSVAAIGATSSRTQCATASAIVQRRVAGGVIAMRTLSFVITAESRTGSSIPQPLAPVTGGSGSIDRDVRGQPQLARRTGAGGSAADLVGGREWRGAGRGRGMTGESAGMLGRRRGSGTGSLARARRAAEKHAQGRSGEWQARAANLPACPSRPLLPLARIGHVGM